MSVDRVRNILGAKPQQPTPEQKRQAMLFAASQAHDSDDLRMLLSMLGLPEPSWTFETTSTHSGVQGRRRIGTQESA